jgi:hypothetical protein
VEDPSVAAILKKIYGYEVIILYEELVRMTAMLATIE